MNSPCDYEYFPWCQITTHPLEISTFATVRSTNYPHISTILNDKLKISHDFDRESNSELS